MPFLYRNFIETLSKRFEANLTYLQAIWNFDLGREFEVAICKTLRAALPSRFGICRGHVVARNGDNAGDDVIIYDRYLFPTLRLVPDDDYSSKEWIPIEAVYAYIEAKHTLNLEDDPDEDGKKSTLNHALRQVSAVKTLCNTRDTVPKHQITRQFMFDEGMVGGNPSFPNINNPMFGMILSRQVRDGNEALDDSNVIKERMAAYVYTAEVHADLIIAGKSNTASPLRPAQGNQPAERRWLFEPGCQYLSTKMDNVAFGLGISVLMAILDYVQLGMLPWPDIVGEAFNLPQ